MGCDVRGLSDETGSGYRYVMSVSGPIQRSE